MTTKGADIYSVFWEPVDGHENKHKCKRCGIQRSQRVKSGCSMNPSTLNDVLFLKSNRHLWNANLIQEIWNEHGDQPDVVIHE